MNTLALLGGTARLNCSTSYPRAVYWQHTPAAAATPVTTPSAKTTSKQLDIFVGDLTDEYRYERRHEVSINETFGQYDLVIKDLKLSDAGSYFCLDDMGFGVQVQAELVVLGELTSICIIFTETGHGLSKVEQYVHNSIC